MGAPSLHNGDISSPHLGKDPCQVHAVAHLHVRDVAMQKVQEAFPEFHPDVSSSSAIKAGFYGVDD